MSVLTASLQTPTVEPLRWCTVYKHFCRAIFVARSRPPSTAVFGGFHCACSLAPESKPGQVGRALFQNSRRQLGPRLLCNSSCFLISSVDFRRFTYLQGVMMWDKRRLYLILFRFSLGRSTRLECQDRPTLKVTL